MRTLLLPVTTTVYIAICNIQADGFGSPVVSALASGTRVRTRELRIWKILRVPSFGGEVKESVSCPSFAARKRTRYLRELQMC